MGPKVKELLLDDLKDALFQLANDYGSDKWFSYSDIEIFRKPHNKCDNHYSHLLKFQKSTVNESLDSLYEENKLDRKIEQITQKRSLTSYKLKKQDVVIDKRGIKGMINSI